MPQSGRHMNKYNGGQFFANIKPTYFCILLKINVFPCSPFPTQACVTKLLAPGKKKMSAEKRGHSLVLKFKADFLDNFRKSAALKEIMRGKIIF